MQFDTVASKIISEAKTKKSRHFNINQFGNVTCPNKNLTSLESEGTPDRIPGSFNCMNNLLSSLIGAPQYVGEHFSCGNNLLKSLVGAPKFVGKSFDCSSNKHLTSLEGVPDHIGGNFRCDNSIPLLELARVDLGNKVKKDILLDKGFPLLPQIVDKTKCTRAYYDAIIHTSADEQHDITNI